MSLDARPSVLVHATEEVLEEYTFGRICEPQLGWLEEHLLICLQCQLELEELAEYRLLMKAGLASFERERQAASSLGSPIRSDVPVSRQSSLQNARWLRFALPRMPVTTNFLAGALLVVLAVAAVSWRVHLPVVLAPVATVRLIALRGGEDVARAPSGRPLDLVFDRTDLPADFSYRAEVIHSSGRQMWSGSVRVADQNLSVRLDKPLRAGAYWVRVYSSGGQLLREFGLNVG
jgi:hypothetical protein